MKRKIKEITLFAMIGALMFSTKFILQALPNIHLSGVIIVAATVVFGTKALYPIYIYVLLEGIFFGFTAWWLPYIYIWTVLWAIVMILPKKMNPKVSVVVYSIVCSGHGFLFGTLFAPVQALTFHLNFKETLGWIAAGLSFDCIHGIGNLIGGLLFIVPLIKLFKYAESRITVS